MKLSFFTLFSVVIAPLFCQSVDKYDSLIFDEEITCLCLNVRQEIIAGLSSGEIIKFSIDGEKLEQFSYPNLGIPSRIDCANPLKVFVFFEDTQRYLFIDRFTSSPAIYEMQFEIFKRVDYLTLAADQSLWSVTSPNITLNRQVQNTTQELYLLSSLIQPSEKIQNLLSVGNTVLLQTSEKLYFFNLAGQLIQERALAIGKIIVARNQGYYVDQINLLLNVVTNEKGLHPIQIPSGYLTGFLLSEKKMVLVKERGVDFYLIR